MAFEAKYNSGCLACEGWIRPGDWVKWADGDVIHAECDVYTDDMRPAPAACPKCFIVPALNGICGCDESGLTRLGLAICALSALTTVAVAWHAVVWLADHMTRGHVLLLVGGLVFVAWGVVAELRFRRRYGAPEPLYVPKEWV